MNGHDTYLQMVCMSSGIAALLPVPGVFNSIQFNSIQFNNFIPDSTEHIQQVYVTLRSICYIRYTICAVYKSTEQ